jgi:hypothetical protein
MSLMKGLTGAGAAAAAGAWVTYALMAPNLQDPVTLTGCLRTGSAPTVYILRGASAPEPEAPDTSAQARDYVLVSVPAGTDLNAMLNHRVAVTGRVHTGEGGPSAPEGANTVERALRRLTVEKAQDVAPNCG